LKMSNSDEKAAILRKLVESGEYERLSNKLETQLLESDWYDTVRNEIRQSLKSNPNVNYETIRSQLESHAVELVPDATKIELLKDLKAFLDSSI
ncbi:hypothetical protein CANCADRAFT_27558, partial [Tortispora caseinolytica NRRL Y-17796]